MDIQSLIELLSPVAVYEGGYDLAQFIASYITPFLLTIALAIRTLETQLDAVTNGQGRWGRFIRDMGVWVTVLAVYFVLAQTVNELFTSLYRSFSAVGSLGGLMEQFSALLAAIKAGGEGADMLDGFANLLSSPLLLIAYGVFYISFILVAFVAVFMQLAHAIAYSCAIGWGLVAIPMSLTTSFRLLASWGKFTAVILVWPVFHFIAFALFTPLFMAAASHFVDGAAGSVIADKAQVYLVFTVINMIACALIVAAPFIAQALITHGAVTGIITPFAAAAMGATATVARLGKQNILASGASAWRGVRHSANEGVINQGLSRLGGILRPSVVQPAPVERSAFPQGAPAFRPATVSSTPEAHAPQTGSPTPVNTAHHDTHAEPANDKIKKATEKRKRRQARRGAIIYQKKASGLKPPRPANPPKGKPL